MAVRKEKDFELRPSLYYQKLMADNKPSLSYDGGDVVKWQKKLRRKLIELLGLDLSAERVDLNIKSIWKKELKVGSIEKIVFASEPGSDVLAYVCIPRKAYPPYKFMICLQGHSTGMHNSIRLSRDEKRSIKIVEDRDFAIGCMERGIGALCIEQRGLGQRSEIYRKKMIPDHCLEAVKHSFMFGKTLVGERVFDVDRGIDYLVSRGDVDVSAIGLMGNSGGGTATIYSAAVLKRISFAMPSCALCTFKDSIMAIRHCACNYIPGIYEYCDMGDILGLFAPRPVVVVAGSEDEIFPLAGTKKVYKDLVKIYAAAGVKDKCKLVVGEGGHRFFAEKGWSKMQKLIKKL